MEKILEIRDLCVKFDTNSILKNISFELKSGKILGIVGESGCGKTTLLRSILGLMNPGFNIESGEINFDGQNLRTLQDDKMRELRGTKLAMIFQNPVSSLDALQRIEGHFFETLRSHDKLKRQKKEIRLEIVSLLKRLHFDDPERILKSYPFELSGGMNQRIAIALAMIMQPRILLADEATSALDVTVQAQIVNELLNLREKYQTAIIFVTHNIALLAHMADTIGVMYRGRIVEMGRREDILNMPMHPYTRSLLNSVVRFGVMPKADSKKVSFSHRNVSGCAYAPICSGSKDVCLHEEPLLRPIDSGHYVSCSVARRI